MKVEFYKHNLGEDEITAITEACRRTILTTGDSVKEAEDAMVKYMGGGYAVGLDSATAGLHLSLLALGIGPGDEVITTAMTFVATPNSVLMAGATPKFVDVEATTSNLDILKIEAAITPKTKAIMPVHLYGQMCDMRELRKIADRHSLAIIEDSAHCIEGIRDGVRPGELGDCAALSFYATKNISCGEGGMLLSRSESFAKKVRQLSCHGVDKTAAERYGRAFRHVDMSVLGWKYNLDNIRASLLPSQIPKMDKWCERRNALAERYEQGIDQIEGLSRPVIVDNSYSARHLQTVFVPPEKRDEMVLKLQASGIGVVVNYVPVHLTTYFRETFGFEKGCLPETEKIGASTITLPLYVKLEFDEVDYVLKTLEECLKGAE